MMDWLKNHWYIITAIMFCGIAWGQTTQKVNALEQTIIRISDQDKKIDELKEKVIRHEIALEQIKENQNRQIALLEALMDRATITGVVKEIKVPKKN